MLTRVFRKQGHKSIGELRYNLYTDTYGMVVVITMEWNGGLWAGTYDTPKDEREKNKVGTEIHHIATNDVYIMLYVRCT